VWLAAIGLGLALVGSAGHAAPAIGAAPNYWWYHYPTFSSIEDPEVAAKCGARMNLAGPGADPTWGPYAQWLTVLDNRAKLPALEASGARCIVWIEGFGDCMVYAITFDRNPDGSFAKRTDDPRCAAGRRTHWCWAAPNIPQGNTFRWVGLHNTVNDEDFALPDFGREKLGIPAPTYPDGRPAVGWLPGVRYPLNAMVYDACGAKDINGDLHPACEAPDKVNDIDPKTGQHHGPIEGLYPAIIGKDDCPSPPGLKAGDTVYCGAISVHKDLSAPFWREYVRSSIRQIVKQGLDGIWCDNYSPWDNFGYPPVQKAFGDWSVARFREWLAKRVPAGQLQAMGVSDPRGFDVRQYLKAKAREFGAKDPSNRDDPAWHDQRWVDEPIWQAFRAFRQEAARQDLKAFYEAIHDEARKDGRPDFCIGGNDIPFYGLGWVRDEWLDMVNCELTPGWHMGSGSRGIMLPPVGKMAPVYRAAMEHEKGPFSAAWYYLNGDASKYQQRPEIAKVLLAEAFANSCFLMCNPSNKDVAGNLETHAWWNRFVREHEAAFGARMAVADVGVLFSPDNQLYLLAPGGFPDMDKQPHVFGYYGWATVCVDAHLPYRCVTDWHLDAAHLAGLRTLILPDATCLEDPAMAALEKWVRDGGRLIVTGDAGSRMGPTGLFARRAVPLMARLTGAGPSGEAPMERRVGRGTVIWTAAPLGMDYYLQADKRPALLDGMRTLIGPSGLADGRGMPTTVGLAVWKSADGTALFADLWNYDIDLEADRVRPAEGISVRMKTPAGWKRVTATTLTSDGDATATAEANGGWVTVKVPKVTHFVSVKVRGG
jgi:hypothetical protein